MTVKQAVAAAVHRVGDTVSREELISWLSEIENTVVCEIAATHEMDTANKEVIKEPCDEERELFVPDPFSCLYISYLVMKADLCLGDTAGYLNCAKVFAEEYKSFADWYNRRFAPLGETKVRLRG